MLVNKTFSWAMEKKVTPITKKRGRMYCESLILWAIAWTYQLYGVPTER
jgi:hypothetical protein